ncbi:MAG: hypothetical protein PHI62_04530 [Candidatus Methanomethylophilaceae archaeon]|nr:hypothetical protein [Candidatus Methanomethylophilaceae archaeon]
MGIKITVKNTADGSTIKMEVDPKETVSDIIDSAAEYWRRDAGAYVLKKGKSILRGTDTAMEINLMSGDTLEMIPDPEGGN